MGDCSIRVYRSFVTIYITIQYVFRLYRHKRLFKNSRTCFIDHKKAVVALIYNPSKQSTFNSRKM